MAASSLSAADDLTAAPKNVPVMATDSAMATTTTETTSAKGVPSSQDLQTPNRSDQTIQLGDGLYISVSPAEELSRDLQVDSNGKINIPLVGAIQVVGLTVEDLARKITHALSRYVTNPKVDVFLRQSVTKQIGVSGQVSSPGAYPYRTNIHLLDVISEAGGFLPSANRKQVRILRRTGVDRKVIPVDVEAIMSDSSATKDVLLEPGDLVEVPRGMTGVSIFGSVNMPGVYEYLYDMRMLDLIALCHGFIDSASLHNIRIIRGEGPAQQTIVASFSKVVKDRSKYNLLLQPGDIVYVPQRSLWSASSLASTISPIATLIMAVATVVLVTQK
jgi:polysaccharide export outer membrane protein